MSEALVRVELRGVPLDVHARATAHRRTVQRELTLVHAADESGSAPARLLWLSEQHERRYAAFLAAARSTLEQAVATSQTVADLTSLVPADAADAAERLGSVLDQVDDHCRRGDLLTLVTPAESVAYRRWFLAEFIGQIRDGAAPTAWVADPLLAGGDAPSPADDDAAAALVVIDEDLDLEGAARFRATIARLVEQGAQRLTIDLTACAFIDSVGISLLLTTYQRLQHDGGFVEIRNASGAARQTLEIAGVYGLLTRTA